MFDQSDIMLLWASSQKDFDMWTEAFTALIPKVNNGQTSEPKIASKNAFVMSVYKQLDHVTVTKSIQKAPDTSHWIFDTLRKIAG